MTDLLFGRSQSGRGPLASTDQCPRKGALSEGSSTPDEIAVACADATSLASYS